MSRKDDLRKLFGTGPADAPAPMAQPVRDEAAASEPVRRASGAVKAMGLQLQGLQAAAGEAEALKAALAEGRAVVALDPALIDPSPYADRLSAGDEHDPSFADLKRSLHESGQQVPVLVRPHPQAPGRYQAAYGHRRVRALGALGRPVQAQVRNLTDAELVLAQGKENAERRDLSFIEKALFAAMLIRSGFARADVQAALALHKAEMTRLLQVADLVPEHIARAIGPAPKAGRPRWMALGEFLKREANRVKAQDCITSQAFLAADSDRRFIILFDRLAKRAAMPKAAMPITGEGGAALATWTDGDKPVLAFAPGQGDFARWLADELPALHARFAGADKG